MVGPRPPMLLRDGTLKRVVKHAGGWPVIDLTGQRFGQLVAIGRAEKPPQFSLSSTAGTWWRCICDCGAEVVLHTSRVRRGAWICRCPSMSAA
jgi:hypothetical protein